MRRHELEVTDRPLLEAVIRSCSWGTLTLASGNDWPYSVPMNHVWSPGTLCVHCAPNGQRLLHLSKDDRVQYTVVQDFSLIPSYASGSELACPASHMFQSVMLWGHARLVEDLHEKAWLMSAFMHRLQPEGKHVPISADDPRYNASLQTVVVIAIEPERMTGKFKFGQNLTDEKAAQVIDFLEERKQPGDRETAAWMRRLRPVH